MARCCGGDEDHFGDAGRHGFFNGVLDQRLVDDRQHFLRARLGGREEPGAKTGYWKYRFCNFQHMRSQVSLKKLAQKNEKSLLS